MVRFIDSDWDEPAIPAIHCGQCQIGTPVAVIGGVPLCDGCCGPLHAEPATMARGKIAPHESTQTAA